jgi:truncated hemoglobin YjbI
MDTPKTTLYDKLGGQQAIEQVVDDFYKLVLADDSVNHFLPTQIWKSSVVIKRLSSLMPLVVQSNTRVAPWKKPTPV